MATATGAEPENRPPTGKIAVNARRGCVVGRRVRDRLGPLAPVLDRLDPWLASPLFLRADEFADLAAFVRTGLLDRRALPPQLCALIPASLPSGMTPLRFEGCPPR